MLELGEQAGIFIANQKPFEPPLLLGVSRICFIGILLSVIIVTAATTRAYTAPAEPQTRAGHGPEDRSRFVHSNNASRVKIFIQHP